MPRDVTPASLFWTFLAFHLGLWTLLPSLAAGNLPLDVIEALAWGQHWQLGYHKHPPLSAWLAQLFRFGDLHWPLFLLSQLMVAGAFWAAWRLALDILPPWPATWSAVALAAVHYHNLSSVEFNANVVQFPFWALAGLAFWRAVRTGILGWWVLLGVSAGLGVLGKYSFLALLAPMGVFLLAHADGRRALASPGPWLAVGICALILTPHVVWAIAHGFPGIAHAAERGTREPSTSATEHVLAFLAAEMLALVPLAALILAAGRPAGRLPWPGRDGWLLITLGLGPQLVYVAAPLVLGTRLRDMWGAPLFVLAGPLLMALARPRALRPRPFAAVLGFLTALAVAIYLVLALAGPHLTGKWDRVHFPGPELASVVSAGWRAQHDRPLAIVVGSMWLAGNVSAYAPDQPAAYIDADPAKAPWLNDADVRRHGAVVLWTADKRGTHPVPLVASVRADLLQRFPGLREMPSLTLEARWLGGSARVHVGWAIIPPAGR